MSDVKLSIVIVHYNTPELLARCVNSINRYITGITKEVVIVDNNSMKGRLPGLSSGDGIKVIRLPENKGFSYANNKGVKASSGEMILFLNSDAYFNDPSINKALSEFYDKREKAIWGFKLLWPDGSFQNSFSRDITFLDFILSYTFLYNLSPFVKRIGYHKYNNRPLERIAAVPIVYATAMLLWKDDFLALGGFDERYFMYFEDIDLCNKFKRELKGEIYHYPAVSIIHSSKGSSRKNQKINFIFLRSKYIYGLKRFKLLMGLFAFVDLLLIAATLGYGSLFYRDVDVERS